MPRRTLGELLTCDEPAWPQVRQWIALAANHVEQLPPAPAAERGQALFEVQVSVGSALGAIVYETGGLLIDHGWLRVLGSGHPRLPRTLPSWNADKTVDDLGLRRGFYLFADDVLGGFFALYGGALGPGNGEVYYLAPDTLAWEAMCMNYSQFVHWCLTGDLRGFYETYRWQDWKAEVAPLAGDRGLSVVPTLFTEGSSLPIGQRSRRGVPIHELYGLHVIDFPKQLGLPTPIIEEQKGVEDAGHALWSPLPPGEG